VLKDLLACIVDSDSLLTSDLNRLQSSRKMKHCEVSNMCNNMKRFEKMAEEKRRRENNRKIDFTVEELSEIAVTSKTKPKAIP